MPFISRKDDKGCYIKWGESGKKYYYQCGNKKARESAKAKAEKQKSAIYASGYKEK